MTFLSKQGELVDITYRGDIGVDDLLYNGVIIAIFVILVGIGIVFGVVILSAFWPIIAGASLVYYLGFEGKQALITAAPFFILQWLWSKYMDRDSGMSHTSTRKEKRRSKKKEGKKTGIVKCPDCYSVGIFPGVDSGDGNCRKCEGVGKTPDLLEALSRSLVGASQNCDICHGSGKCQTCRGKGYVNVGIFC